MKKDLKINRGITLIAMIITILVMLILAVVVVNIATDGSIFEKVQESAFKSDVRSYQEYLSDSVNTAIIQNGGAEPDYYEVTNSQGTGIKDIIPDKIKNEYNEKLEVYEDGKLYYMPDGMSALETKWAQELGLKPIPSMDIEQYIEYLLTDQIDTVKVANKEQYLNQDAKWDELGNFIDLIAVKNRVQAKYPDAAIALAAGGAPISEEEYKKYLELVKNTNEILNKIKESGLDTGYKKYYISSATTNETILWILEKCKENEIAITLPTYLYDVVNSVEKAQIGPVLMLSLTTLQIGTEDKQIAVAPFDGTEVKDSLEQVCKDCIVMSKAQADLLFEYTAVDGETDLGTNGKIGTITKYKGNAKNIDVPGIIVDSETDESIMITTIGAEAFASDKPNKWPILSQVGFEDGLEELRDAGLTEATSYQEATLADIQLLGKMMMEVEDLPANLASITDKDTLSMELLFMMFQAEMGLDGEPSDYFELGDRNNGDYEIYAYVIIDDSLDAGVEVFKKSELEKDKNGNIICNQPKEKITLSRGIMTIGTRAFARNIIGTIYFPESIEKVASDAFQNGDAMIQTRMSETSFKGIEGWTYYDLFGTYNVWHQMVEFID